MKHLKRFNEEIGDPQYDKCHKFHQVYKKLVKFDEDEYLQGDEPSRIDLLSEIGDLCNRFNMTKEDVKFVLDNFDCAFDSDKLLQIIYDEWEDETETESGDDSEPIENLVERILDAAKLDVDAIKENDPEFVDYICSMITDWMKNNK